jgi:hypothetical protein
MELKDLSGIGRISAEVRRLVLGLAKLYSERETRKIVNQTLRLENELLALKNADAARKIVNAMRDCLEPTALEELRGTRQEILTILQDLRVTLPELHDMQTSANQIQYPTRLEADALKVDRSTRSRAQRSQTMEKPSGRNTSKQPSSSNVIRKMK